MNVAVWHVLPLDLVRRYAKELHVDEVSGKRGSSRSWRASTVMMRSVRICLKRTLQSSPFAAGRSIAAKIELLLLRSEVIFTILSTKCCAHSIRFLVARRHSAGGDGRDLGAGARCREGYDHFDPLCN